MKNWIKISPFFLLAVFGFFAALNGCKGGQEEPAKTGAQVKDDYTCSMHPAVSSDKPGACPICGMVLEKRSKLFASSAQTAEEKFSLSLQGDKQILANVATSKAEQRRLERSISTVGAVEVSEQRLFHVASRVPGRIEKLFVDYTGAFVNKGDSLFVLYSPELVTAQKEYLLHVPKPGMPGMGNTKAWRKNPDGAAGLAHDNMSIAGKN